MDSGTLITSVILVIVCILPFVLVYMNKQKKKKIMLNKLAEIAKEKDCSISKHEFSGHATVIGLDENKKHVFFYKKNDEGEILKSVNLAEISSCKTNNGTSKGNSFTERVQLRFIPKVKDATETFFDLYNVEHDTHLGEELLIADKWSKLLNETI